MRGWWDDEPVVVVHGSVADDVKATAFVQADGGGLIALANFGNTNQTVTLSGSMLSGITWVLAIELSFSFSSWHCCILDQ